MAPQHREGQQVFIDATVLIKLDALQPPYLSRTGWVNQLLDQAIHRYRADLISAEGMPSASAG